MKIKIGKLFEALSLYNGEASVKIRDEYGNYVNVKDRIIKQSQIWEVTLENGDKFRCGEQHRVQSHGETKFITDVDTIDTVTGNSRIVSKNIIRELDNVYDFEVDSASHLYSLPNGTIHHNTEFSGHTRDVLDIIPSSAHFGKTIKCITGRKDLKVISNEMGFDINGSVTDVINKLALEFKSDVDGEGNTVESNVSPFWWNDGATTFYVSPREMTECVANTVSQLEDVFDDMGWDPSLEYTDEQFDEFIDAALNTTSKIFMETFAMIELKHEMTGFVNLMGNKITMDGRIRTSFEGIRSKKSANVMTLSQILESAEGDIKFLDKSVMGNYLKDFSSTEMIQDIMTITDEYISELRGDDAIMKMLDLSEQISKSLKKLNASGMYNDQLQKYVAPKILGLLSSGAVDALDVLTNEKLIARVEKLAA